MDRSRRSNRPLVRAAALVLLVGLLLGLLVGPASCTNDDNSSDDPTPTTQPPVGEVEAAYLDFWDMATRLAGAPDPEDPELQQRASGDALGDLAAGLAALREQKQHSELGAAYVHDVLDVRITGDASAVIEDCAVDDSRIVDDDTGDVVVEGVGTQLLTVDLVRREGQWLVETIEQVEAWEGAVPCT